MVSGVGLNRKVGRLLGIWPIPSGMVAVWLPSLRMAVLARIAGVLVLVGR